MSTFRQRDCWLVAYGLAVAMGELDPNEIESGVAQAMESARRRSGLTVDEIVRRLRPVLRLPETDKPARHNWYDWRRRPHSIPAVALVAAARLAGVPVDRLFSSTADAGPTSTHQGAGVGELQRRVADLERKLEERDRVLGVLESHIIDSLSREGKSFRSLVEQLEEAREGKAPANESARRQTG